MAICAWLLGPEPLNDTQRRQVYDVCEGFLCPSLGAAADYRRWITDAGLTLETCEDWTDRVRRTWQICKDRVESSRVRWLARALDRETLFLDRFDTILSAYGSGAMRYGCLIARAPQS
jgi:tocopherol O-methyltransferase